MSTKRCCHQVVSTMLCSGIRFSHFPTEQVKQRQVRFCKVPQKGARCTISLSVEKPIVRAPRPQDFNLKLPSLGTEPHLRVARDRNDSQRYPVVSREWMSTTREATEEYALPTPRYPIPHTTLEVCADPVRDRAQKTHPEPCLWQCYAREWDMMQPRRIVPSGISLPKITDGGTTTVESVNKRHDRLLLKRPCKETEEPRRTMLPYGQFTQPMPGYGGFVPRNAVEPKPISDEDCDINTSMCSTSRRTYRAFPPEEYHVQKFAHSGLLSKTITLTYPFNSFNKIE